MAVVINELEMQQDASLAPAAPASPPPTVAAASAAMSDADLRRALRDVHGRAARLRAD